MLPYLVPPEIGGVVLPWYAMLAGLAVFVAIRLVRWRAPHFPVDPRALATLPVFLLLSAFVCSHLVHALAYTPDQTWARPQELVMIWRGHSSFGGFLGALIGTLAWCRWPARRAPLLPVCELVASVFPIAWTIGRLGCALIHDHVGQLADAPNPLTVAFPDGPRYDLGLLEAFVFVAISVVFVSLWRRPRRLGTYTGLGMVMYAPLRFGLDFLRIDVGAHADPRYAGLTVSQWGSLVMLGVGLWVLARRPPLAPAAG